MFPNHTGELVRFEIISLFSYLLQRVAGGTCSVWGNFPFSVLIMSLIGDFVRPINSPISSSLQQARPIGSLITSFTNYGETCNLSAIACQPLLQPNLHGLRRFLSVLAILLNPIFFL